MRNYILTTLLIAVVAACGGAGSGSKTDTYEGYSESGPINDYSRSAIQLRQLDLINAVRSERGMQPVQLSAQLTAAGLTHARDIAAQQRAWNYGSDKSTPQSRGQRAGFHGIITGENVSESYRGELQIMQSWLSENLSRSVILDPKATHVGIAYLMEPSGKVWWVQDFGAMGATQTHSSAPVQSVEAAPTMISTQ